VLVGRDDVLVDEQAAVETGRYLNTFPVLLEGVAHDVMLDTRWEAVACELEAFIAEPGAYRVTWPPPDAAGGDSADAD